MPRRTTAETPAPTETAPQAAAAPVSKDALQIIAVERLDHPGVEARTIQVLNTTRALAELGHRVSVHLRPAEPAAKGDEALELWLRASFSFDTPDCFHARPLSAMRENLAEIELRGKLLKALASAAVNTVFYARNRRLALALARARRWVGRRARLVYELHELEHLSAAERGDSVLAVSLRREEDRLFRLVDGIVAVSDPLAADLATLHAPRCPVQVIGGGVDFARFCDVGQPNFGRETVQVMYAGSLGLQFGVEQTIAALRELPRRVELTVVGGEPESELVRLRSRLSENGALASRVRFAGQVEPRAVPGWLAKADLLLLPVGSEPRAHRWASPLKLFEAMATGIPIVAAPCDAHEGILADGETAYIAEGGDGPELAAAIERVLAAPEQALAVGQRARKQAEAFDWRERARRLADFVAGLQ